MIVPRYLKGQISAKVAYPIAEQIEKRTITEKLQELECYYRMPFTERKKLVQKRLADMIAFAAFHVPYYRDLFQSIQFDPTKLNKDIAYLNEIPYLTKDIIRAEGDRLLSTTLADVRHHLRKTGGSTGLSCHIYYDQEGLDYSAATTLYARQSIGKKKRMSELHFACEFPEEPPFRGRLKEGFKCFAMNRSNIFFSRLDDESLEKIWRTIKWRRPHLVHAHPSTIYTLACYVKRKYGQVKAFKIFESSGELLEPYMRDKIAKTFSCQVIDRYGLAELGVVAYQTDPANTAMQVFDSEVWPEIGSDEIASSEVVFTGLHNRLMPLIRYRTGDLGQLIETENGFYLDNMVGRIHDIITIKGVNYATHYIQDILDRIGGIQEFQVDQRHDLPKLLIVLEPAANQEDVRVKLVHWLKDGFEYCFVEHKDLIRVGERAKFRHVVQV